jgi:hypothetical protein
MAERLHSIYNRLCKTGGRQCSESRRRMLPDAHVVMASKRPIGMVIAACLYGAFTKYCGHGVSATWWVPHCLSLSHHLNR